MKIKVNKDLAAFRALMKANVPINVIEDIAGKEFTSNAQYEIDIPCFGQPHVTWTLPPAAITVITQE
jgi:hypothetical protein